MRVQKSRILLPFGLIVIAAIALGAVNVGQVDPDQESWYKRYSTQENAPKPEEMLINTDKEPALTEGFTPLFNGKDLTGWTLRGKCKFEVKNGNIVGTCIPGEESTYLCTDKSGYTDFIFTCLQASL